MNFFVLLFIIIFLIPFLFQIFQMGRIETMDNFDLDSFPHIDLSKPVGYQLVYDKPKKKENNAITDLVKQCSKIKSCDEITKTMSQTETFGLGKIGCGYCIDTGKFYAGNIDGPLIKDCSLKGWSFDAASCQKNKEKNICEAVNSCMELPATGVCGWCDGGAAPINKAFPVQDNDGELSMKYPEDENICMTEILKHNQCTPENTPNDICSQFDKKLEIGYGAEKCLLTLWKRKGGELCHWEKLYAAHKNSWAKMSKEQIMVNMDTLLNGDTKYFSKCYKKTMADNKVTEILSPSDLNSQSKQRIAHKHEHWELPQQLTHGQHTGAMPTIRESLQNNDVVEKESTSAMQAAVEREKREAKNLVDWIGEFYRDISDCTTRATAAFNPHITSAPEQGIELLSSVQEWQKSARARLENIRKRNGDIYQNLHTQTDIQCSKILSQDNKPSPQKASRNLEEVSGIKATQEKLRQIMHCRAAGAPDLVNWQDALAEFERARTNINNYSNNLSSLTNQAVRDFCIAEGKKYKNIPDKN